MPLLVPGAWSAVHSCRACRPETAIAKIKFLSIGAAHLPRHAYVSSLGLDVPKRLDTALLMSANTGQYSDAGGWLFACRQYSDHVEVWRPSAGGRRATMPPFLKRSARAETRLERCISEPATCWVLSLFTHTMSAAAILSLIRRASFFLYVFLRSSGLAVAVPGVVHEDQNLFTFGKFDSSRTFASSYRLLSHMCRRRDTGDS